VRNLLTPLLLCPQQLRLRLGPGHPALELCDRLSTGLGRLSDVIEDLLTLGRRGQLRREPTDLNAVVRDTLEALREPPATLQVAVDLSPDLPSVAGSAGQLGRVVANLVTNAREAMQDRGILTLRSRPVELAAPRGLLPAGRLAVLEVGDTGCGIPREQLHGVFEPFFTTKAGGTRSGSGLGLAIVQAIAADHGGVVEVASEVGVGTTFTVSLPAA
jgi:signal transduction histidine kinase